MNPHDSGCQTLRVLLVGYFVSSSLGIVLPTEELAMELADRGWHVVRTSRKPTKFERVWDMVKTTWVRRHDYDIAHVDVFIRTGFIWAEVVCRLLRYLEKPYSLTLHSGGFPEWAEKRSERVRMLLSSANAVTAPSSYLVECMKPYRDDIRLVPNPLNIDRYPYKERYNLDRNLVWVRSFLSTYNATLAPRAVALLREEFPEVTLTMAGPTLEQRTLDDVLRVVRELGLEDIVRFPGTVPKAEIPNLLRQGDIFLNTTNRDNVPITVLEAMASGMCVVSTRVDGIPYLLNDRQDALLVPPDDPEALAGAIRRLWTDPDLARILSRNGRTKAEAFDWKLILPQWKSLFCELAKCNQRPRADC